MTCGWREPVVPDAFIISKAGLESPDRTSLLTVYEGLAKNGDADPANKLVPTTLEKVKKTQAKVPNPATETYDLFCLSTFEAEEGAQETLDQRVQKISDGYGSKWLDLGWIHYVRVGGKRILVVYKSRIAKILQQE